MNKQDRQGARTPAALDQKYNIGRAFSTQEKENARQNKEMSQQQMTMREFISFATSAIERINSQLAQMGADIGLLKEADSTLSSKQAEILAALASQCEAIQGMKTSIEQQGGTLAGIGQTLADHSQKISAMDQTLASHGDSISTMAGDIKQLSEKVAALEGTSTT